MSCQTFQDDLIDLARDQTMDASQRQTVLFHLQNCRVCSDAFSRQRMLTVGLRAMAIDTTAESASPKLEENLRHAFRQQRESGVGGRPRRVAWLAAAAAVLLLIFAATGRFFRLPLPENIAQPVANVAPATQAPIPKSSEPARSGGTETAQVSVAAPSYFFLLDQDYPIEMGLVLRVTLPISSLATPGADFEPTSSGEFQADVLLGEDGLARGIRLLPESQ